MSCGAVTFRVLLLAVAVAVAGCTGEAAGSLAPTGSPDGSPTPTFVLSPAPSSSPTAVGSSTARPDPSPSPTTAVSGFPAGWRHDLVCRGDDPTGCQLHLYDATGREQPNWPVPLAGWCPPENVAVDSHGAVYVACVVGDELTVISSFAVTGSAQPGWPVEAEWQAGPGRFLFVGPDDTIFVSTLTGVDDGGFSVHAFGVDGRPRSGWPQTLPGAAQSYTLAPDGTVIGWWYEDLRPDTIDTQSARTKFTMIGPNGKTLPGRWPITSIGTATEPIVTKDGGIFYTS